MNETLSWWAKRVGPVIAMDASDVDRSLLEKSDITDGLPLLAESDCGEESMYEEAPVKPRISDPVKYFLSIGVGIVLGVVLNIFNVGDDMVTIVTMPGALFIRALQCAVIPVCNATFCIKSLNV
jgi:hypothetical protein